MVKTLFVLIFCLFIVIDQSQAVPMSGYDGSFTNLNDHRGVRLQYNASLDNLKSLNAGHIPDKVFIDRSGLGTNATGPSVYLASKHPYAIAHGKTPSPVPEPSTLIMLGTGLIILAAWGKKARA